MVNSDKEDSGGVAKTDPARRTEPVAKTDPTRWTEPVAKTDLAGRAEAREEAGLPAARFMEVAREISPELEQRFSWILSHVPEMQRHLLTYTSERALLEYLELMRLDGMIETHADAMSALRLFSIELLAIVLGDFTAGQLKRMTTAGTLNDKEAWRLRTMVDALQRLNKVATEMGAEAGFSKKSRAEMGIGQQSDALEALKRIAAGEPVPEARQVGAFLVGQTVRSRPVEAMEAQYDVLKEGQPVDLNEAERRELVEGVGGGG